MTETQSMEVYYREVFFDIHEKEKDRKPRQKVPDSAILMMFNGNGNRMQTSLDVSKKHNISRARALERLKSLEREGLLTSEKVNGMRVFVLEHLFPEPYNKQVVDYLEGDG